MFYLIKFSISIAIALTSLQLWASVKTMDTLDNYHAHNKTVHVLDCGTIRNKSKGMHTSRKRDYALDFATLFLGSIYKSNPCLLIKNNGRYLLWEAGNPDSIEKFGNKGVGKEVNYSFLKDFFGKILFRFYITKPEGLVGQLAEIGLNPEDIHYIALSHLHYDHAGNIDLFPNATIIIQKQEYDSFNSETAESEFNLDLKVLTTLPEKTKTITSERYDVFGDGSAILVKAPGHSPGHQMLELDLAVGKRLLSGDLYSSTKSFKLYNKSLAKHNRPPIPSFNHNKEQTYESYKLANKILKESEAKFWIQHASDIFTEDINEAGDDLSSQLSLENIVKQYVLLDHNLPSLNHYLEKVYMGTEHFYILND